MYTVYIIKCKTPNHYYIGYSENIDKRLMDHKLGKGSKFTKIHGFSKCIYREIVETKDEAKILEKKYTIHALKKYGINNAAGAGYSQVKKNYKPKI